jgi:hypothetical protein
VEDRYELNTNSPRFPLGMGMDRTAKRGAFGIDQFGIWACDLYVAVIKPRVRSTTTFTYICTKEPETRRLCWRRQQPSLR